MWVYTVYNIGILLSILLWTKHVTNKMEFNFNLHRASLYVCSTKTWKITFLCVIIFCQYPWPGQRSDSILWHLCRKLWNSNRFAYFKWLDWVLTQRCDFIETAVKCILYMFSMQLSVCLQYEVLRKLSITISTWSILHEIGIRSNIIVE